MGKVSIIEPFFKAAFGAVDVAVTDIGRFQKTFAEFFSKSLQKALRMEQRLHKGHLLTVWHSV